MGRRPVPGLARLRAGFVLPLSVALAACAAEAPPPPVLGVGDVGYTAAELGALSGSQKQQLADLTAFGLAVARGELARVGEPYIRRERQALALQRLAAEVSVREAGLDEARLRERYDAAPEYELVVRHLVILSERWRSDEERAAARREAEAALARIRAGEDFGTVAGEVSDEPSAAERGGLLRPGRRGTWVPEFWQAASALDLGEVSGVVETEYGFHVLRLEDRRPIPFEEVRGQVLGRLVDLAAAAGRAEAWAERQVRDVEVHVGAIARWRRDGGPDTLTLASWPGGVYRALDLRRYLLTLDRDALTRLELATDSVYAGVVAADARNAYLVERAVAMGVELTPDEAALVERRWVERASGWATALGFRPGADVEAVKAAALEALAARQQSAQIARDEVLELSRALRALYPVTLVEPEASEPAASSSEAVKSARSA